MDKSWNYLKESYRILLLDFGRIFWRGVILRLSVKKIVAFFFFFLVALFFFWFGLCCLCLITGPQKK